MSKSKYHKTSKSEVDDTGIFARRPQIQIAWLTAIVIGEVDRNRNGPVVYQIRKSKVYPADEDRAFYILRSDRRCDKRYDTRQPTSDLRWPRRHVDNPAASGRCRWRDDPSAARQGQPSSRASARDQVFDRLGRTHQAHRTIPPVANRRLRRASRGQHDSPLRRLQAIAVDRVVVDGIADQAIAADSEAIVA